MSRTRNPITGNHPSNFDVGVVCSGEVQRVKGSPTELISCWLLPRRINAYYINSYIRIRAEFTYTGCLKVLDLLAYYQKAVKLTGRSYYITTIHFSFIISREARARHLDYPGSIPGPNAKNLNELAVPLTCFVRHVKL